MSITLEDSSLSLAIDDCCVCGFELNRNNKLHDILVHLVDIMSCNFIFMRLERGVVAKNGTG